MRKIVIAPDSFKETMASAEVCDIVAASIRSIYPKTQIVKLPIADGGEGTVDAYLYSCGGEKRFTKVFDPLMREVRAYYGIIQDKETAVIEMAQASGLPLVDGERNVLKASSFGTGQLILKALNDGCRRIILGIGGSATNDGGAGAFDALGVRFLNKQGKRIEPGGAGLADLDQIDIMSIDKRIRDVEILISCDVDNILCGKDGASHVFGPQKGASKEEAQILDENLHHYAKIYLREFGVDYACIPGTGAAGGIALPFLYLTKAKLTSGIDAILDTANFTQMIKDADLVITGEGRMDGQSLRGKVPVGVARYCKQQKVKVVAVVGSVGSDIGEVYPHGINAVFSTVKDTVPFAEAKKTCREDLAFLIENLMRFLKITSN